MFFVHKNKDVCTGITRPWLKKFKRILHYNKSRYFFVCYIVVMKQCIEIIIAARRHIKGHVIFLPSRSCTESWRHWWLCSNWGLAAVQWGSGWQASHWQVLWNWNINFTPQYWSDEHKFGFITWVGSSHTKFIRSAHDVASHWLQWERMEQLLLAVWHKTVQWEKKCVVPVAKIFTWLRTKLHLFLQKRIVTTVITVILEHFAICQAQNVQRYLLFGA